MKTKVFYFAIIAIAIGFAGCKKSSNSILTSDLLSPIESKLKLDYTRSQQYNNILTDRHKIPGMTMNDATCRLNDSLYHKNDTSFTMHIQDYCKQMMADMGMGSNGMMGGGMMGGGTSGGMMCNMDSMMTSMSGMMNMTTFKMDSMMEIHMKNCPKMGTLAVSVQDYLNNMQSLRKVHMKLHK